MRVLLTGARGFVGRWLTAELESAGHTVIPAPPRTELDLSAARAADGVASLVSSAEPDAVAHLAGVAYGPDATAEPERAIAVNAGGTQAVLAALDAVRSSAVALIVSTGDVYGRPTRLPIREDAPLAAADAYGRSKIEEERVALAAHAAGRPVIISRSFNHTGPGQRDVFAAPALARRVLAFKRGEIPDIPAGNLDARRDFTDVRDVVRAYRLLLERVVRAGELPFEPPVVNVGSGRSVAIRELLEALCRLAGVTARVRVDPSLLRAEDPPEIRADVRRLRALTGWSPTIPLDTTLTDLLVSIAA